MVSHLLRPGLIYSFPGPQIISLNAPYPELLTAATMLFHLRTQTWHPPGRLPGPKMTHWQLWPSPLWLALVELHWFGDSQDNGQRATGRRIRREVWIFLEAPITSGSRKGLWAPVISSTLLLCLYSSYVKMTSHCPQGNGRELHLLSTYRM